MKTILNMYDIFAYVLPGTFTLFIILFFNQDLIYQIKTYGDSYNITNGHLFIYAIVIFVFGILQSMFSRYFIRKTIWKFGNFNPRIDLIKKDHPAFILDGIEYKEILKKDFENVSHIKNALFHRMARAYLIENFPNIDTKRREIITKRSFASNMISSFLTLIIFMIIYAQDYELITVSIGLISSIVIIISLLIRSKDLDEREWKETYIALLIKDKKDVIR